MKELFTQIETLVPTLEGWTTPERACEMAKLIIDQKPKVVVTIGVFGGRSVIAQAMAARYNGTGVVYGLDPWKLEAALEGENEANREWWTKNIEIGKIHQDAMNHIWRQGLDSWAVIIRAASQDAVKLFRDIGVLEIDGNHSEPASCRDVDLYLPRVKEGGFIWMDDTDWPSTAKAQLLLEKKCKVVKDSGKYKLYQKK